MTSARRTRTNIDATPGDCNTLAGRGQTTSDVAYVLRWEESENREDGYSALDKLIDYRNWSADGEMVCTYTVRLFPAGDEDAEEIDSDGFDDRALTQEDIESPEPYEAAENRLLSRQAISRDDVRIETPW